MCSRYTVKKNEARIRLREQIEVYGIVPREDVRLTDLGPVLVPDDDDGYAVQEMNWGWVVPWDKKPLNNAKSETLTTLATFKPHLANRCLILATTFYEKSIQFHRPERDVFCLAGLWRPDQTPSGHAYTMITTTPNESVAPYHHRMPFILRPEQHWEWLRGDWQKVLAEPDKRPLDKFQKQPDLF